MTNRYVTYCRVSTKKQGDSGLGLEAQRIMIQSYLPENAEVIGEFSEAHSGTDLKACAELQKAIALAKREDAILIVAKYDRFRDLRGALEILDELGAERLFCCDMPSMGNPIVRNVMFTIAEEEARWISVRTKAALAVRKKQIAEEGGFISNRSGYVISSLGNPKWRDSLPEAQEAAQKRKDEIYRSDPKRQAAYKLVVELKQRGDTRGAIIATLNSLGETMRPDSIKSWNYENYRTLIKRMG